MKNVKMMISALAILGVVGSALAFKPAKGTGTLSCVVSGACTTELNFNEETTGGTSRQCNTSPSLCESDPITFAHTVQVAE